MDLNLVQLSNLHQFSGILDQVTPHPPATDYITNMDLNLVKLSNVHQFSGILDQVTPHPPATDYITNMDLNLVELQTFTSSQEYSTR